MALIVVLGLAWLMRGFESYTALLSLIPSVLLLFIFTWSLAVLLGCANVHFQDTQHLAEVGFQFLFYATPIMYAPENLVNPNDPTASSLIVQLVRANPLMYILQLIREPILQGHSPSPLTYTIACSTILVTVIAACVTLSRLQRRLVFHL